MKLRCRTPVLVLATAALAAGCGQDGEGRDPARPRTEAVATPTPPSVPRARKVRFEARDGRRVAGLYTPAGEHAPAVVLVDEMRGGPSQWDGLIPHLHAAGFATLTYRSRSSPLEHERLPDALGAVRWLRKRSDVDRRRIALVGASIGASTVALAMATGARRSVDAAVALSPPGSIDIWDLQDDGRYRPHDLLVVSDDREAEMAAEVVAGAVRSKAIRSREAGHGVVLLEEPEVRDAVLDWLDEHVRP